MTTPEDLYREKFSGYAPEPPQGLWNGIDRKLSWRRFTTFSPKTINIYYVAAAFAAASLLGYHQLKTSAQDISIQEPMEIAMVHEPGNPVVLVDDASEQRNPGQSPAAKYAGEDFLHAANVHQDTNTCHQPIREGNTLAETNASYPEGKSSDSAYGSHGALATIYNNAGAQENAKPTAPASHASTEIRWGARGCNVAMEANTSGASPSYLWDLGDGNKAVGPKVSHQYGKAGKYRVRLVAFQAAANISDTIYQDITVTGSSYTITFPNALVASTAAAPFMPKGNVGDITAYKLNIYSRNGKEVFSTTDPSQGWHGYYHGDRLPKGVYAYRAVCRFANGEQESYTGSITIFWEENTNLTIHP